jgi:hypothetical protein
MTVIDAWPIVFCSRCGSACMTCGTPTPRWPVELAPAVGRQPVRPVRRFGPSLCPDLLGILPETSLGDR